MESNKEKIRFAVVGCGHIGKRHAEMVVRDPGAELVALCDIRPKEELGIEAYPVAFFSDMTSLLQSGLDIDVINICSEWSSCRAGDTGNRVGTSCGD